MTTSRLLGLAALTGAVGAAAYFTFAPAAEPVRRTSHSGSVGARTFSREAELPWREYRDEDFRALRDALDRSDPDRLVEMIFDSLREGDTRTVLAASTDLLQTFWTPDTLREATKRSVISNWSSYEIVTRSLEPQLLTLRIRFTHDEGVDERRVRIVRDAPAADTWSLMAIEPARRRSANRPPAEGADQADQPPSAPASETPAGG